MAWDPLQYRKFAAQRAQPFWDLAGLVQRDAPIRRAADLGCGSGELTAALAAELDAHPVAGGELTMSGVDSSGEMLADAAAHARDNVTFSEGDIAVWTGAGEHDLVFANASLQWVADHPVVLERWSAALAPGGQLAVQVPANGNHPSHTIATEVGCCEPFASAMSEPLAGDPLDVNVLAPEVYAELLHGLGYSDQHVRLQVYGHLLASSDEVVEWIRGTGLTRFFARLPAELHGPFVDEYRSRLIARLGDRSPYFYAFKRILLWGRRPR